MTNSPILGRGWSFPPQFNKERGEVLMTTGETDIQASLHVLLNTTLGERTMVPKYGCNLNELLFKPIDLTMKTYIIEMIKNAILYHEARISVNKISMDQSNILSGQLLIKIEYIIRSTNSRHNYVFPYYLGEANNI